MDCSNRADTTTPRQLPAPQLLPKNLSGKGWSSQDPLKNAQGIVPAAPSCRTLGWAGIPSCWCQTWAPPRPALLCLELGALCLMWPPQGKFQNFPSWDHMSRARRAGQVGVSGLTHPAHCNPQSTGRSEGLALGQPLNPPPGIEPGAQPMARAG